MQIIDVQGKPCPMPVVEIKKALKKHKEILAIIDDRISVENVKKFLNTQLVKYSISEKGSVWEIKVKHV